MNPDTGQYVPALTREAAGLALDCDPAKLVMLEASKEQMEVISRRVRQGAKVEEQRKRRRKQQRKTRRQNR